MKVLLINPTNEYLITTNVPNHLEEDIGRLPPLGLLYIASYLEHNSDHSVEIYDALLLNATYDQIAEKAIQYDLIGIMTITFFLNDVIETVKAIRKLDNDIPIVLGGPHLAIYPEETAQIPGVTYSMTGECDQTFTQLVNTIADGKNDLHSVPGLYWRENGNVRSNSTSDLIADLDELPVPDRKLLEYKSYQSILSEKHNSNHRVTTMFSSRGCPYKCIFCDRPNLGKNFRFHSPERVIEEIEHCVELGINEIFFYDDTFTVNKNRVLEICELILQKKLNVKWDIRARVNDVDYEMLMLMKRAGCSRIHFGVEAGSREMMKVLKKGITRELAIKAFENAKKAEIETLGYFMFGCPGETKTQMQETIDLALILDPNYALFSILTPFPGTPIYDKGLAEGLFNDYWREYSMDPKPDFVPEFAPNTLSRDELIQIMNMAYKTFYLRPNYIFKQALKVKSMGDFLQKAKVAKNILLG